MRELGRKMEEKEEKKCQNKQQNLKKKKEGGRERTIHHVQSYIANIFQLKKMKRRSKKV
jgi:hypothetical protein